MSAINFFKKILPISILVSFAMQVYAEAVETADLVVRNAYVFTSSKKPKKASAFAVKNGKFIFVGNDKKVQNYVGTGTEVIDAKGNLVTPGFIDAHTHAVWLGMLSPVMTMIYDAESVNGENGTLGIKQLVQDFAAKNPDLPFILAIGWKYDYIPGGIPTKEMADAILSDRPLILWSHEGHTGWVNSLALADMQKNNPKAFEYLTPDYDANKKPTGIFRHFYAVNPFDFYEVGGDILDKMADGVKAKLAEGLSVGVTTHNDVMIHSKVFNLLLEMKKREVFKDAKVRGLYFINHHQYYDDKETVYKNLDEWKSLAEQSDEHLIIGNSIKLGIDGVGSNHTAFLYEPYADEPENYGVASYEANDFNELCAYLDSLRLQICTHGVGDKGITRIIDGYENAAKINGLWDSRHSIEHCSMVINKDIKRMKKLKIYASMQPAHYFGDQSLVNALGTKRFRSLQRIGTLHRAKINLAFGTDYSIVPMNPLYNILIATTRLNCLGLPTTKAELKEAISVEDSIRHYTIGSAKIMKLEDKIGSIEVGKNADFVIFSTNFVESKENNDNKNQKMSPFPIDLDRLVLRTYVDGRLVYQK